MAGDASAKGKTAIVDKLKAIMAKPGVTRIGIIGVAVVLGGLLGSQLIAPRIIAARSAKIPGVAEETSAAGGGEKKEAHKKEAHKKGGHKKGGGAEGAEGEAKGILINIDNIIVNPAGSQGSRFLMASIAVELPDSETETYMREHEVQIRDVVISVLESQTMQSLARPGARDQLKDKLAEALLPMSNGAEWLRVYIPQFVIQ